MGACGYWQRDFTSKLHLSLVKVVWVWDTIRRAAQLPAETHLALKSRARHGQSTGGKESLEGAEAKKKAYRLSRNALQRGMGAALTTASPRNFFHHAGKLL